MFYSWCISFDLSNIATLLFIQYNIQNKFWSPLWKWKGCHGLWNLKHPSTWRFIRHFSHSSTHVFTRDKSPLCDKGRSKLWYRYRRMTTHHRRSRPHSGDLRKRHMSHSDGSPMFWLDDLSMSVSYNGDTAINLKTEYRHVPSDWVRYNNTSLITYLCWNICTRIDNYWILICVYMICWILQIVYDISIQLA